MTTLWWLKFIGGRVVIIEGESLAHARLLATVNEFGRASQFIDGYAIDCHLMEQSPKTILDERFQEPMPMTYFNNLGSADRQHGTPKRRKHPQVRQQLNPAGRSTALGAWASEIQKAKA